MRVLDPYPGAESWPLDFSLADLHALTSQELLSVHLHPLATKADKEEAKVIFWQRRDLAFRQGREEGSAEATAELRQMKRAEEWLAGRAPGSRQKEEIVKSGGPSDGGKRKKRKGAAASPAIVETLTLSPSPSPPSTAPKDSTASSLVSNPAPFAETWKLNFSLDDLDSLPSYQLLAVQVHPFAATFHRRNAREIYRSRRRLAEAAKDKEEDGGAGDRAKSQQVKKAQDQLAGEAPTKGPSTSVVAQAKSKQGAGQSRKKRKTEGATCSDPANKEVIAPPTPRTQTVPSPLATTSTSSLTQLVALKAPLHPFSASSLPAQSPPPSTSHAALPQRPIDTAKGQHSARREAREFALGG